MLIPMPIPIPIPPIRNGIGVGGIGIVTSLSVGTSRGLELVHP